MLQLQLAIIISLPIILHTSGTYFSLAADDDSYSIESSMQYSKVCVVCYHIDMSLFRVFLL